MTGKSNGKSESGDIALKYHFGVDMEIAVAPDFYFQPGLLFTTKGFKDKYSMVDEGINVSGDFKMNVNYLELPLNLAYKPLLGDGNLILAFGPYLGYAIGGKSKISAGGLSIENDLDFGSDDEDDLKPFDMGANLSFGYMFSGGFSVQFNTQLGLINILPGGDSDNSMKNTGFGLSVGYRF